jgi:nucleolar protein 56
MTVEIDRSNADNDNPLRGEIERVIDEGESPQGVTVFLTRWSMFCLRIPSRSAVTTYSSPRPVTSTEMVEVARRVNPRRSERPSRTPPSRPEPRSEERRFKRKDAQASGMTEDGTRPDESAGWSEDVAPDDPEAGAARIREGRADAPEDWPARAVEVGFAEDEDEYYAELREVSLTAAREAAAERERATDQQLVHAVRAMDDAASEANELAERVAEWAGSRYPDAGTGVGYARELAAREPESPTDERLVSLARRVADLADESEALREFIERETPEVAPNLAAMAGPVLAARLISLAGDLDSLAKMPSGTVQVLGAEDSLFAHLRGRAPSPKHGVIFTHEFVRGTHPDERGSAARTLAGKLTIAARVDNYSGERKPELDEELQRRMDRIRGRRGDDPDDAAAEQGGGDE